MADSLEHALKSAIIVLDLQLGATRYSHTLASTVEQMEEARSLLAHEYMLRYMKVDDDE